MVSRHSRPPVPALPTEGLVAWRHRWHATAVVYPDGRKALQYGGYPAKATAMHLCWAALRTQAVRAGIEQRRVPHRSARCRSRTMHQPG